MPIAEEVFRENNKMIAGFMGHEIQLGVCYMREHGYLEQGYGGIIDMTDCFAPCEMKYMSEWNWIMPVVAKINMIDVCIQEEQHLKYCIHQTLPSAKVHLVYDAVCNYLKWYLALPGIKCGKVKP